MTTSANSLTERASHTPHSQRPTTMPATQLRAFADGLGRLGYDVPSLLRSIGHRASDLEDPDGILPCAAMQDLVAAALTERYTPNIGAHLASMTPLGSFPLIDYLVVTTDTVGDAIEQLARYFHIVNTPITWSVVHDTDVARVVVLANDNVFAEQFETSLAVHHLRAETEGRLRVLAAHLTVEPENRRDLEALLRCPVRAPSTWSGIESPREMLTLPLRRRDPALRRVLEGHAAIVAPPETADVDPPIAAQVRTVLVSRLARGVPEIADVAQLLATSSRTLQRRLAAEGSSYEQIVEDVRRESAERLLANPSLSIGEIGYLLGFSEPSAFHRAFKRWHELTPAEFRSSSMRRGARD